jgi:hypothetical protein
LLEEASWFESSGWIELSQLLLCLPEPDHQKGKKRNLLPLSGAQKASRTTGKRPKWILIFLI